MSNNKAIINYLKQLIEREDTFIQQSLKDCPEYKDKDTFCYECGYDTHDINYHEKYLKNFLSYELEQLTKSEK